MEVTRDVVVIGAGPAGATAAALAARAGRDVLLVDRDSFPREKVCGEFLSWDAMPVLDLLGATAALDALGSPVIDTGRIAGAGRYNHFPLPGAARGVSRYALDALLAGHAEAAGCTFLQRHAVTRLTTASHGYLLTLHDRATAEETSVHARAVIGAWGRWGRLDQELGRSFTRAAHRHFGFRRHAIATGYARPTNVIELHSFEGGYLGVSSIENGITNICGLVASERVRPRRDRWSALERELRDERPSLETLFGTHSPAGEYISSDPVIFGGKERSMIGVPFAGDTSGMIDPLTGNGMAMAIQSGALAFCSVMGAAQHGWNARWTEWFEPRLGWSRIGAALLSRPALVDAGSASHVAGSIAGLLTRRTRVTMDQARRLADEAGRLVR